MVTFYDPKMSAPWLWHEARAPLRLQYANCASCDAPETYAIAYGSKEALCKTCWQWADRLGWCRRY